MPFVFSDPIKKFAQPQVNDWTDFPEHRDSLGIPRTSMPQVKSKHRGALIRYLNARGYDHSREMLDPEELLPSQKEFSPSKVQRAQTFEGPQRAIIVSNDNHVADGHHQWLAALGDDEIPVIKIDCPIQQLLMELSQFPSSGVADNNGKSTY